jgi:hypothetical protein
MIDIRCKACKRLAFKASDDATGTFQTRCQRSSCGRVFMVTLPFKRRIKEEDKMNKEASTSTTQTEIYSNCENKYLALKFRFY